MAFNSLAFLAFFPIVTLLYTLWNPSHRLYFLLVAGCFFYMWGNPWYILVIAATVSASYFGAIQTEKTSNSIVKKRWLIFSIVINLAILFLFKYYYFTASQINNFFNLFSSGEILKPVGFIIPLGLSFHTFQAMAYSIEVYRGNYPAEKHAGVFALYIMFYPQMIAGPIERPAHMLPQLKRLSGARFEDFRYGMREILWGFFKKLIIADRLSVYVDGIYNAPGHYHGMNLLIAVFLFSFQLYADFSGYCHIALGAARCMGIELTRNFSQPFMASSLTEFWRKWHITLTTWFTDFVYNPLAIYFRTRKTAGVCLAILITFLLSGIWHGAGWNFMIYGLIHGAVLTIEFLTRKQRRKVVEVLPGMVVKTAGIVITFSLVSFSWVFFRSPDVHTAGMVLAKIFSAHQDIPFTWKVQRFQEVFTIGALFISLTGIILLIVTEWMVERNTIKFSNKPFLDLLVQASMVLLIILFGSFETNQFIYFQF